MSANFTANASFAMSISLSRINIADSRIAAELYTGVVAVEARELEAPVRELLARPLVELAPGSGTVARELLGRQ